MQVAIQLINFDSGELEIVANDLHTLRLVRDQANRLIMAARMHTVDEFLEKLPFLLPVGDLLQTISHSFEGKTSTERWNLKEKFARLRTSTKDYVSSAPHSIAEEISF